MWEMNKVCGNNGWKEAEKQKSQFFAADVSLLLFCILLMFICGDFSGVPALTPSDVAVMNGTNFSLRCSINTTQELWWYRLGPGATSEDHIVGSVVNARFRSFYTVLFENQVSTLTILAVPFTAATYACVETFTAERATAKVTVLESKPFCWRNVTDDILNLTCVVTFTGQDKPIVKWIQFAGKEEKEITDGIVNSPKAGPSVALTGSVLVQLNETNHWQVTSINFTINFCLPDDATRSTDDRLCVFSQEAWRAEKAEGTSFRTEEATGTTPGIFTETNTATCHRCNVASGGAIVITVFVTAIVTSCFFLAFWKYSRHREKRAREKQQNRNEERGLNESVH